MVIDKLAAGLKAWLLGHLLERADNQNNTYRNVFPPGKRHNFSRDFNNPKSISL